jgi:2-polyprenyl-3-methyl-5-hydroxy-6-metoxy-1,4-benzoquinol methylase
VSHDEPAPHPVTPAEAWEFRYAQSPQRWSGSPNATLVHVVSRLTPGRAVDLGCGEGADAVWLARQGWTVLGVDISPTAIARARGAATEAGLTSEQARFEAHDLSTWEPEGEVDLVTASFFHSREELPRADILRRAAAHVAPGGHVAIVSHAAPPPWSEHAHHDELLLDADGEVAALELDENWQVIVAEHRERVTVGPDGTPATLEDVAVLLRRRPQA